MNGGEPLVSVIIPAFNASRYLRAALDSVFEQTYPAIEVIVVDDGSDDDMESVLDPVRDRITFARQAHLGIGAARNHGVRLSRGPLLSFLDADDLFARDKTRQQVDHLLARPSLDLVFGHVEEFVSEDLSQEDRLRLLARPGIAPALFAQSMLVRREAFERVGPFTERLQFSEFIEWYSRAHDAGLAHAVLPDLVFLRRVHAHNTTRQHARDRREYVRVVKAAIDRRRDRLT